MPLPPVISFCQVTKRFSGVVALSEVSLDVVPGELHAIVGENGAGKSTLVRCLSGVIADYEGTLLLRGTAVRFRTTKDAERAGISIIRQELNLVELLAELECEIRPGQPVRELRVGDQQLVEIAKALSLQTNVLVMDEPTSALTEAEVKRLFRVIDRLRERGVTILYISHKMDEVFRLADRITVLRDGRLVKTLDPDGATPREVIPPDGRPRNRGDRPWRRQDRRRSGPGGPPSLAAAPWRRLSVAASGHQLHAAGRRDRGDCRADGGRTDRVARMPVRLQR